MVWKRILHKPFLIPQKGTLAPDAVTTPDLLFINDQAVLYVGSVSQDTERIIRFPLKLTDLNPVSSLPIPDTAQIVIEPGSCEFNFHHVFDPATILWNNQVFLYYSAMGNQEDSIGVATSDDGRQFVQSNQPIITGRSPEVAELQGELFLFYVKREINKGYNIYCAKSNDGFSFSPVSELPVLRPGSQTDWDAFEVTTPRIFKRDNIFYMTYSGSQVNDYADVPVGFGLARSTDLVHWEKFPYNPVFQLGNLGDWDDGALWFGTVFEVSNNLYLIYEGGRLQNIIGKSPAYTQVGLAMISGDQFDQMMNTW